MDWWIIGGLCDYLQDPSNLAAAPGAPAAAQLAASEGLELMQTSHPVQTCSNMFKHVQTSSYFFIISQLFHISYFYIFLASYFHHWPISRKTQALLDSTDSTNSTDPTKIAHQASCGIMSQRSGESGASLLKHVETC